MLKRLRFKASLPALISGGTKKSSGFAPNAPFASSGQQLNTRPQKLLRGKVPLSNCMLPSSLLSRKSAIQVGTSTRKAKPGALRSKTKAGKQKSLSNNNKKQCSSLFILSIDSIPPNISPQELREALSVYGEILSSSMRVGADGLASCHVKFKSLEAKTRALAARWITIKDARLPIPGLLDRHDYILIRIANISMDTTEVAIHSICTSFGEVFGLARTKEGAADVMFRVKDFEVFQSIAKHLSDVVIDGRRWSAKLLTKLDDTPITNAADSQRQVGLQITSHLDSFRNQLDMHRIYLEDLENLHHAVLHLRNSPPNL